jgi:hypothetical protein
VTQRDTCRHARYFLPPCPGLDSRGKCDSNGVLAYLGLFKAYVYADGGDGNKSSPGSCTRTLVPSRVVT